MPIAEETLQEELSTFENTKVTIDRMYAYIKDGAVFIRAIWLPRRKIDFSESGL